MVALGKGSRAPAFSLPAVAGKSPVSFEGLLDGKGAILAFFKVECPTCQLEFPFVDRMAKALAGTGVAVLGVGQNPSGELAEFSRRYGITFPLASEGEPYPTSDAYGLTHVPTLFLVDPKGTIRRCEVGFSTENLEAFLRDACDLAGTKAPELFTPKDDVPPLQPG